MNENAELCDCTCVYCAPDSRSHNNNAHLNSDCHVPHDRAASAAALVRQLVEALECARRVVSDRAAGGNMITPRYVAADILETVDTAQEAARAWQAEQEAK